MTRERYKQIREELRLTQAELAMVLNVTRMTINRREAGAPGYPITQEAAMAITALIKTKRRKRRTAVKTG